MPSPGLSKTPDRILMAISSGAQQTLYAALLLNILIATNDFRAHSIEINFQ